MGSQPVNKLLLSMGLPMILSMAFQALYNIVDSYFVSSIESETIKHFGDYALNSLALSFPVQMLMIAVGVGTGVGVNALISKNLGANNKKMASEIANNAIFLATSMFFIFFLFSIFGVKPYINSQTSDSLIRDLAYKYVTICTRFSFGILLTTTFSKILQGTGRTVQTTIAQFTGALTNIILDPILIFGLFNFPELGVAGAAYATVTGQIISLILNFTFYKIYCKKEFDTKLRNIRPKISVIRNIYTIGLPAIIMQSLTSFMTYSINIIFLNISIETVAAYGVYYRIQQFAFMAMFGLNNALIPILGFNYGMKNKHRVLETIRYSLKYFTVISISAMLLFEIFANSIVQIFQLSHQTKDLCLYAMRIIPIGFIFVGSNIAFQGIFQALGHGVMSLILSISRLVAIVLPVAWILSQLDNAGKFVWISFPIAESISFLIALTLLRKVKKQNIDAIESYSQEV